MSHMALGCLLVVLLALAAIIAGQPSDSQKIDPHVRLIWQERR